MGSQSAVMMKMAGEQWQYGKRRISAMTNEEFNKMTPLKLFEIETTELKAMIPLMKESMHDMNQLTPMIVQEMIQMFKDFINEIYKTIQSDTDSYLHPFFNFLLEQFGLPTRNISKDFDNDPSKFLPPGPEGPTFPIPPPPTPPPKPPGKTQKEIEQEQVVVQKEIIKTTTDPLMVQYTTFLNKIVFLNKTIAKLQAVRAPVPAHVKGSILNFSNQKKDQLRFFDVWKKNNRAWLSRNNLS